MQFGLLPRLLLPLVMWTAVSAAAQNPGASEGGCRQIASQVPYTASTFGHGLAAAPRNAIRWSNLKWALPIAAAAGLLIASATNTSTAKRVALICAGRVGRIQRWSWNRARHRGIVVLGGLLGTAFILRGQHWLHCARGDGRSILDDLGIKAATNRQYAYAPNTHGEFWEGGKSFPSGHAAASFAFASVIAHRYPNNRWLKWSVYGLAAGVSLARVGGKKHFASDILVGGTLGYLTGTYLASH